MAGQTFRFKLQAYPSGYIKKMVMAYAKDHEITSESDALCQILTEYFKSMPTDKRNRLENKFKNQ